ncbi:hypothetical protein F383_09623 [Gossypium arboreum]|uniref:Uncharacterized protein n=1 Tax=Gossypium arboreum TaxID=29729 RepID=A0A0B0P3L0_GOSAR|nr:hypothetical protein F383_12311 [Gossypium arboreum]KHG19645.1 hypothetical protein F383_09623 [Gossypium arboreum]
MCQSKTMFRTWHRHV